MTYTSLTMKDILDLTYVQFKNIVEGVGKRINWEMKVNIASAFPEAMKDIKPEDFPLSSVEQIDENRVFTMKDALALQNMANS